MPKKDNDSQLEDPSIRKLATRPVGVKLDFTRLPPLTFLAHDILRCELTGTMKSHHKLNRANIVQSVVQDANIKEVDFSGVDLKDTSIKRSVFFNCNMAGTHFNTCYVMETDFERCRFTMTNFNRTEFRSCRFIDADFSNLLIKACRFEDCLFENCTTTNKLFESCLLLDCKFEKTELQVRTILDNFGIEADHLRDSPIRTTSPREGFEYLSDIDFEPYFETGDFTGIERFKGAIFCHGFGQEAYEKVDEALDIRDWRELVKVPSTFSAILSDMSAYLEYLFVKNRLMIHPILLLHTLTGHLADYVPPEMTIFRDMMGVHMSNARIVELFLQALFEVARHSSDNRLRLTVTEELSHKDHLQELFPGLDGLEVVHVIPTSSYELLLQAASSGVLLQGLAILLCSRLELELKRFRTPLQDSRLSAPKGLPPTSPPSPSELLRVRLGGVKASDEGVLDLRYKAILPGSLLIDLKLNFNPARLLRVRKIFKDLILRENEEGDELQSD